MQMDGGNSVPRQFTFGNNDCADTPPSVRLGANLNQALGHQNLFLFLEFAFKGMFGAVAWFREIAVGAIHHRIRITVRELACHGVVARLGALVGFERTLPAVGIVLEMIGSVSGHGLSAVKDLKE